MVDTLVKELGVEDLYGFLEVSKEATEKELTKAYRRKALRCHPDKNPDDPAAAAMFQKLSRIYNMLTDASARAAYDKWMKARESLKKRNEEMSVKRKQLKETLESKENEHYKNLQEEYEAQLSMKKEIERLREMSYELMRKRQEELLQEDVSKDFVPNEEAVIQVTWEDGQGPFTEDQLHLIFSKYGNLERIIPSKKKRKALINFTKNTDAMKAVKELSSSFHMTWMSGEPHSFTDDDDTVPIAVTASPPESSVHYEGLEGARKRPANDFDVTRSLEDIENDVFAKLRKLHHNKQL